jgi:DNA-binding CsgD family transcriptional regulator
MSETLQADDDGIADRSNELYLATPLSKDEAEVFARKEAGQTHAEIGDKMGIEREAVDNHAHSDRVKYDQALMTVQELRPFYETGLYSATIPIRRVIDALLLNSLNGIEQTILVPREVGGSASIQRGFSGSEQYVNPDSAPVHIKPERLVEDGWERPPTRADVDLKALDVPEDAAARDWTDGALVDEAFERLRKNWTTNVRRMVRGDTTVKLRDHNDVVTARVTVVGVED